MTVVDSLLKTSPPTANTLAQNLDRLQRQVNTLPATPTFIAPRSAAIVTSAYPGIDTDAEDVFTILGLSEDIVSFSMNLQGSPVAGQTLLIRILDDGTPRAITWGSKFASATGTLPTTTTASTYLYVLCVYNDTTATWDCLVTQFTLPSIPASSITGILGLAHGGTGVDLSASGGATKVLAQDASHVVSARDLIAADIPSLDAAKITTGQLALARGGTNADLSATGGTSKFLKQASAGAAITVVQPAIADLSDASNVAKKDAQNTFSHTSGQIIQGPLDLSASTAGQIIFPATQNASAGANTLDDYEEGNWTPTGNGITITNNSQAKYVKIGKVVYCTYDFSFPSTADTNLAIISGHPFASAQKGGNGFAICTFGSSNLIFAIDIFKDYSGNNKTNANMSGSSFTGGFWYFV